MKGASIIQENEENEQEFNLNLDMVDNRPSVVSNELMYYDEYAIPPSQNNNPYLRPSNRKIGEKPHLKKMKPEARMVEHSSLEEDINQPQENASSLAHSSNQNLEDQEHLEDSNLKLVFTKSKSTNVDIQQNALNKAKAIEQSD